jgi:beta-glucosidase
VWYPGPFGGTALADVLFGKISPAGRLPVTFPMSIADVPPFTSYDMQGRTYRYSTAKPLYPFGYGLSYSNFTYTHLQVSSTDVAPTSSIDVTVRVANTGKTSSDEVVQLYVEHLNGAADTPKRELRGFQRVHIPAGQTRDVHFTLPAKALTRVTPKGARTLEPGSYRIHVGGSQPDPRSVELLGQAPLTVDVSYGGKSVELPY